MRRILTLILSAVVFMAALWILAHVALLGLLAAILCSVFAGASFDSVLPLMAGVIALLVLIGIARAIAGSLLGR